MQEITANVNWIAVIAGFILSFLLGWLWYSPKLFGRKWAEGVRIKFNENMKSTAGAMITQAVATFLLSWVVGVTAANDALITMILIVVAIVFLLVANGFFCRKNGYARATEAGYIVAMTAVMIVCQGVF